ncbi:hypothetical protein Y032_0480g2235 [Ancylostoma ceylanicum]|nr:hypothetical protein Y032_0480g2235 [Ancylostoma ceylanicum]
MNSACGDIRVGSYAIQSDRIFASILFPMMPRQCDMRIYQGTNVEEQVEPSSSSPLISSDVIPPRQHEDLLNDASSLHAKMLKFSQDLDAVIMRRKEVDAECSRLAEYEPL